MRLYLSGHEYKYAVEQMLLTLFPHERPEYPEGQPSGERMEITLTRGRQRTTASCIYRRGTERFCGRASTPNACLGGQLSTDRSCQRLVKNAMYRAALASGVPEPVWGALTGVRPGKLLAALLEQGSSEEEALRQFREEYRVSPERAALCLDASRHTLAAKHSLEARDVCLYVGIPFCPTRCAYCSFVSQSVEKSMKLIPPFLAALEKEIAATAEQVRALGLRVVSIYMGGGTPTTLSADELDRLCAQLEDGFDLSALREYTVEAGRPDTITAARLRVLRAHGVDRVSVNPQSMSDAVLEAIGRRHTAAAVEQALETVRAVGGFSVNMDLIAGLPADSAEGFSATLERVLSLAPENVTVHTLSLKKGSRITLEGTELPSPQDVGRMLDLAGDRLRAAGYAPYYLYRQKFMSGGFENVGWAQPGSENLYNICIMEELCSILAMGGGGSTKLIRPDEGRNLRLMAPKYPLEYIENIEKTCADKAQISAFYHAFLKEDSP
ncbi:MAG: coproporphyrinogen dehydrogenase HemZ [Oscillospiraceae bacterium]|nr:coproporphyrinogen dehydrogenase HemZ [Oscillospiraceae bacterium]